MNVCLAAAHLRARAPVGHRHHMVPTRRCSLTWFIALLASLFAAGCGGGSGSGSGSGSDPITQPAIAITQQPADQSVTAGSAATFRIASTVASDVQWQRLGTDGQWSDVAGATQAELVLTGLTDADNGRQYRAQIRAANGAVQLTSSVVTLRVAPAQIAPALAAQPVDVQLRVGQAAQFSVTATGTLVIYQWQASTDGQIWSDVAGGISETLTLSPAALSDSGRLYRVIVRNSIDSVTSRAVSLAVLPALQRPLFTAQPQDRSVEAGQGTTFTATSSGEPAPTLQWETSIDGQAWTPVAGAATSTLVVASASLADRDRLYRAVATNSEGREVSGVAKLTVAPATAAPALARQPQPVTVTQAQSAAFEAEAVGNPTPTYQWQVSVDNGVTFVNVNGATNAKLELATTTDSDEGKLFRVIASNRAGDVTSPPARLTVQRLPQVTVHPTDVTSGVTDAAVSLVVAGTGLPVPTVQWQVSRDDGATFQDIPGAVTASFTWSPTRADDLQLLRAKLSNAVGATYSRAARVHKARWTSVSPSFVGASLDSVRWLDSRVAVAVGDHGAIVRTADAGATWQFIQQPMADLAHYQALAVLDSSTLIAAGPDGAMIRSEDKGLTWRPIYSPATGNINSLSFRNASIGVMNSYRDGAFRTVDGGLTWTRIASADASRPLERLNSMVLRGMLGFATGESGRYRSVDGGASWRALDLPWYAPGITYVTFVDDQTLVISGSRFERSTDGGQSWQPLPLISGTYSPSSPLRFSRDGQVGVDVWREMRSVDRGLTWAFRGGVVVVNDVDFSPDNVALSVGQVGELSLSTDLGATWQPPYGSQGLDDTELWGVEFPNNDAHGIAFGSIGRTMALHQTNDGGLTWQPLQSFSSGSAMDTASVFADAEVGMAVSGDGPLIRTTDGGRTWIQLPFHPTVSNSGLAMVDRNTVVVGGDYGLYRSTDGGSNWTATMAVTIDPTKRSLAPKLVSARGNVVLAPTLWGDLHRSTDGGRTWTLGSYSGNWPVSAAWTSPSTVFILDNNGGLNRSDDAGLTWRRTREEPVPQQQFNAIRFSADGQMGILISNAAIYRSSDGGQTWNRDLAVVRAGGRAVAFTGDRKPVVVGSNGGVMIGDGY